MKSLIFVALTLLSLPTHLAAQETTPVPSSVSSNTPTSNSLEKTAQVFQILTGVGTLILLFQSFRLTRQLKKADILLEFFRRFDQLIERRESINLSGSTTDSQYYYQRFWILQNDQFTLWREGYIEDRTYRAWLDARHEEYRANESTGNKTYLQGWDSVKTVSLDVDFQKFMDEVFAGRASEAMKFYKTKN